MVNSTWDETRLKAAIAKAREAADIANAVEPRAESAYYDQSCDRFPLSLTHSAIRFATD